VSCTIRARNLGVRFLFDRQRRPVTPMMSRLRRHCSSEWGLRGVDLEVEAGESVALIGSNGAGKTTLLRVMAGVMPVDEGDLLINGRVGSLLSVDAGLTRDLTGRENSMLLGVLAGLQRAESRAVLDHVVRRSQLGHSFERPVSGYSQGMAARLGFAVVELATPDILLLDEVHEALDHDFRATAEDRARRVLEDGGIVIAAGHDHAELERLCDRAVLLHDGAVAADGPFAEVLAGYLA
jgi:ABC-type polysaccharide/polyol phosphate transport system ATPase subunit